MKTATQKNQKSQVEDMISLRDILEIFIFNWKWFIVSALVCLALSRLYLATQPNIYQRSAVLLVKDDNGNSSSRSTRGTDALMQLNGVMMGTNVKNEVYVLQSHQLMMDVVRLLHLDVQYLYRPRLRTHSLYTTKPFIAEFDSLETSLPYSFKVKIDGMRAHISDLIYGKEKYDTLITTNFNQEVTMPFGKMTFVPNDKYFQEFDQEEITVVRTTTDDAANFYGSQLNASELDKESTLVGIIYTDNNIQRATDILNAVLNAYRQGIIDDKNRIAQSTAAFIDKRIEYISQELSAVEGELAQFKQRNQLVNIEDNARQYLQESGQARQRSIQLESQVSVVKFLLDELKSAPDDNNLIPTLSGLTDNVIQNQITRYNELMLQLNKLLESASDDNPYIIQLRQQLAQMKATIIASTTAHLSSLNVQLNRAKQEEQKLSSNIVNVPAKEKEGLDIARQQSIKETLYTYLLNKREETALQLAITEANIRIVEEPFGSNIPIAPRKNIIMLAALLIGIVIPYAFFYIRSLLNMSVRGRKDVETYTTIPVLGEIPHRKESIDDSKILVGEQKTDSLNEAFRMLRFSMNFIQKDARVIMFTSTTPGEGKTFVSRNFSVTLGMTGKKVLLIDADIRKRTQSRLSGNARQEGLTSYLSGSTDDWKNIIINEWPKYNVDMMPAGITPPNPSELLMSGRLEQLIEELKEVYDYIVIDNVPAQVVADAGIVNRVADITLYVIREGVIDRRYLPELERLYQENKFNHLCIVINDSKFEEKRYGYGYGYGHYGYGYGMLQDDPKRSKKRQKK